MTAEPRPKPWFRPKRIGYGISPNTWQGWLIVVTFIIVVLVVTRWLVR